MTTIILIEKTGVIKELVVKSLNTEELYKKAGFKTNAGFKCFANWNPTVDGISYSVYLYGKINGKAGQENKFDYPPPVDNVLFFGSCLLLLKELNGNYIDFKKNIWNKIYDYLFEEFEYIEKDDDECEEEEEEEEDDVDDDENLTQQGYVKDGFIVDDDAEEDEEDEVEQDEDEPDDEEDEDADEVESQDEPKKKNNKKSGTGTKEKNIKKNKKEEKTIVNYLNCCNELEKEEYI